MSDKEPSIKSLAQTLQNMKNVREATGVDVIDGEGIRRTVERIEALAKRKKGQNQGQTSTLRQ